MCKNEKWSGYFLVFFGKSLSEVTSNVLLLVFIWKKLNMSSLNKKTWIFQLLTCGGQNVEKNDTRIVLTLKCLIANKTTIFVFHPKDCVHFPSSCHWKYRPGRKYGCPTLNEYTFTSFDSFQTHFVTKIRSCALCFFAKSKHNL